MKSTQFSTHLEFNCRAVLLHSSYRPHSSAIRRIPHAALFSSTRQSSVVEASSIEAAAGNAPPRGTGRQQNGSSSKPPPTYARLVPASPSYFTGNPRFTDSYLAIQALHRKYLTLPTVKPSEAPRRIWRTLSDYRGYMGDTVRSSRYSQILGMVQQLNLIHPSVMPDDAMAAINAYQRDIDPTVNTGKPIPIDKFGRACGAGRRKTSTARAWVVEGNGEVIVNGKTLVDAFGRIHDRESAIWPLKATDRIDKYNVWALVEGGGTTGQAEAMTLAVAKALIAHEPLLKPALRRAGCVTRDPRKVERKKHGHVKARKKPAWVKR